MLCLYVDYANEHIYISRRETNDLFLLLSAIFCLTIKSNKNQYYVLTISLIGSITFDFGNIFRIISLICCVK